MNARLLVVVFGLAVVGWSWDCCAEPPVLPANESETVEQLRREVAELRQTVDALRAKLNELEYQGLPQAAKFLPDRELAEAPRNPFPVGYLRFPYHIERGTSAPVWWNRTRIAR
jgi:hypothetical protein